MRIVGVDPGANGALALLVDGRLTVADMPQVALRSGKTDKARVDCYLLKALIEEWRPTHAFVERVGGLPKQSASAAFNFGLAAGSVHGVLVQFGIGLRLVETVAWKRETGVKLGLGKDPSKDRACQLFPANAKDFALKKHIDRAEAALIAEYGRRLLLRENGGAAPTEEGDLFG